MKRLGNFFAFIAVMSFFVVGTAGLADAQRRNERQIRDLVRSLNAQIDDFQFSLDNQLRSNSTRSQDVENVHDSIRNLQTKVDDFEENLNNRRENRDDVREIVNAAKDVDAYLANNQQNRRIDTHWQGVRTTINNLASNYGVTPDWGARGSQPPVINDTYGGKPPRQSTPTTSVGLTGTYQLDTGRSENTSDILSSNNVSGAQRQDLESKLEAPEQIALFVNGTEVTIASSKASAATFVADGREKTEQQNGRSVRLRATLRGSDELTITSLGGETDYSVTFTSTDNGRTMKVTRRITTDYLSETVFAESLYNKTDAVAGLGINRGGGGASDDNYSSNDPNDRPGGPPTITQGGTGEFIVPSGTIITGLLDSSIDTKVTQNNDRFKLTVQSPDEFRGATIEGYVTGVGRSGQVSGRSNVTFNFETITLRNGQRYDFAGYLQSVKDQNGKEVRVDTEGTAKGQSQTKETAKRGGIGAGLGAIIGAIAGGGKGAAIGAIIGGGAGAGSVVVQGRDDLQLMKGSSMTIQSTSPAGTARREPRDN